jgi:hypothetical protein
VGRDGIFVESVRVPGALARYNQFFARYESIGTVRIVRRGVFLREVYLYRGTNQICPFPFDGRFENWRRSHRRSRIDGPLAIHSKDLGAANVPRLERR